MLLGYIDVACLIPSSLAILLFMDYDSLVLDRRQLARDVLISICLLISFLFRRYFAYFAVGYGTALCLYSAYGIIRTRGQAGWVKRVRNAVVNIAVVGLLAAGILLLFFRPLVVRVLTNNYAKAYEGYNAPLLTKFHDVIAKFGPITFVLAGAAIILCFITKKARKLTLFCAVSAVVTTAAFFRVQGMGIHHIYTIASPFYILMVLGIVQICDLFRKNSYRVISGLLFVIVIGIGTANCFLPTTRRFVGSFAGIYAQQYYPLYRNDIAGLHSLADYMNSLTDGTDDYVYVCASSGVLNCSIMDSLNKPYSNGALHNMYWTSDVDLRDGFKADLLRAKYVIVTDPVQLHLAEDII